MEMSSLDTTWISIKMAVEPTGPSYTVTVNYAETDIIDKIVAVVQEIEPEAPLRVGSMP